MKTDMPPTIAQLIEVAAGQGFVIHERVGGNLTPAISVDGNEDVIRFFQPELEARPWGNQLSGCIGLGLRSADAYPSAVFHHVLNYRDFLSANRTVDDVSNFAELLAVLREHLKDLPGGRAQIIAWAADPDTWLGKLVTWGRPQALAFIATAKASSV